MTRRIAYLAVIAGLVLASGAYAAGTITGESIKNNSLTGTDIKNRSLKTADLSRGAVRSLRGNEGPIGDRGPAGPPGAAGAQGAAGVSGLEVVQSANTSAAPGQVVGAEASCPSGKSVVGTGFYAGIGKVGFVKTFGNSAGAGFYNDTSITLTGLHVQAICASVPGAAAAATRRSGAFARELQVFEEAVR